MAIVKYGTIVTEVRGKVGGTVYQRCGGSLSIRSAPSKRRNRTTPGLDWRNLFAQLANYWRNMSLTDQATWRAYANTFPTLDKWGNTTVLQPYALFVYVNAPRILGVVTIMPNTVAYNPPPYSGLQFSSIVVSTSSFRVFLPATVPAGYQYRVYISIPYLPNSEVANPKYYFAFVIPAATADNTNFYAQLIAAARQAIAVDQLIYIKVLYIRNSNNHWLQVFEQQILVT